MSTPSSMDAAAQPDIVRLRQGRSRVSNGSTFFALAGADHRSSLARRYRDIVKALTNDLGGDLTEAQMLIAKRAATLGCWCELNEAKMAAGTDLNIVEFTTATNALRRLLADLGLERRARDITPSIASYIAAAESSR